MNLHRRKLSNTTKEQLTIAKMESSQQGPPNLSVSPCHYYFRWASTSNSSLGGLFFFCWYLAYEYHNPPVVLMTNPVTFKACTCTPPSRTKPRVWRTRKRALIGIVLVYVLYRINKCTWSFKEKIFDHKDLVF